METTQKIISRHFLFVGLSLIGLALFGCKREDMGPLLSLKLSYVNQSSRPITVSHFARGSNLINNKVPETLSIGSGDTVSFYSVENMESGQETNELNDFHNFIVENRLYDSAYVSFDNEKYIYFSKGIHNTQIFSTKHFEGGEVKENQFEFFYIFTEEDFETASYIDK